MVIAVCGAICGADNWVHIAEFGRSKYDWLKTFLELPNGIPSHDTFGRVFARISPEHFQDCFSAWVQSLLPKLEEEIVPIDGKTLRHSYDRTSGKKAVHMVNAWAVKNRLVLGQFHCEGGLDEITIIPELLRVLALKGCIVTVDAIGCHKSVDAQKLMRKMAKPGLCEIFFVRPEKLLNNGLCCLSAFSGRTRTQTPARSYSSTHKPAPPSLTHKPAPPSLRSCLKTSFVLRFA